MMDGNWYGWSWGWMPLMPLLWVGLVALIVWAVVRIARPGGGRGGRPDPTERPERPEPRESPSEILDRRLASGEIDIDTYTQTRAQLHERDNAAP